MVQTCTDSLAYASEVQLGIALGKGSTRDAKRAVGIGLVISLIILSSFSSVLVMRASEIGRVFSSDPTVLALFERVRWPLMCFIVLMNLNANLDLVPSFKSRIGQVFQSELSASLSWQLPGVLFCFQFWHKDLKRLLTGVSAGYTLLLVLHLFCVLCRNWEESVKTATAAVDHVSLVALLEEGDKGKLVAKMAGKTISKTGKTLSKVSRLG